MQNTSKTYSEKLKDYYKSVTHKRVKALFDYDKEGYLVWKERDISEFKSRVGYGMWHARFCGKRAGHVNELGYVNISITIENKQNTFKAHRLIYLWHNGILSGEIDHKNRNKSDNRIDNLRLASHAKNQMNCGLRKTNSSGFKGVYRAKETKKWIARISYKRKRIYLGSFNDRLDAAKAYNEAAIKYFGEFAFLSEI
jgi:hypothetical protein